MSENQARLDRDLYDHEHEEPRSSGARRRRPVADWGVGDDVFEHMPRNRFSRAAEGPSRERRFASRTEGAERRLPRDEAGATGDETGDDPRGRAEDGRDETGDVPRGRVEDGRRTIVIGRPEDVPSEIAALTADRDLGDGPDRDLADDPPPPRPAARMATVDAPVPPAAPGERRTIRIGGRPEGSLEATRARRRRPPRTAHERVGARPDRVAAWAVALGLLLILIAVLSAL
jgi:hypothetical protein